MTIFKYPSPINYNNNCLCHYSVQVNFVENWRKSLEVNVVLEVIGEYLIVPLCAILLRL